MVNILVTAYRYNSHEDHVTGKRVKITVKCFKTLFQNSEKSVLKIGQRQQTLTMKMCALS